MITFKFGKSLLLIVVLSILSLGLIQTGAAYTLGSSSGIWTAVTGGPDVVYAGVGTSSITWGTPASGAPSGSTFSGATSAAGGGDVLLVGGESLGGAYPHVPMGSWGASCLFCSGGLLLGSTTADTGSKFLRFTVL